MKAWLMSVGLSLLAMFAPAKELFIATGFLIAADLITGLMAAHKTGVPITSAGLRRTVSKIVAYNFAVGSSFLVQKYMLNDLMPIANIASSAIGLTELKSIIENTDRMRGTSVLKEILSKLGSRNDTQKPPDESQQSEKQGQP